MERKEYQIDHHDEPLLILPFIGADFSAGAGLLHGGSRIPFI